MTIYMHHPSVRQAVLKAATLCPNLESRPDDFVSDHGLDTDYGVRSMHVSCSLSLLRYEGYPSVPLHTPAQLPAMRDLASFHPRAIMGISGRRAIYLVSMRTSMPIQGSNCSAARGGTPHSPIAQIRTWKYSSQDRILLVNSAAALLRRFLTWEGLLFTTNLARDATLL